MSVQFSCSIVSDSLRPHEPQHTRPPSPSLTPSVLDRGLTDLSLAKTVRKSGGKGERVEGERETGNMKTQAEFLLRCCVSVVLHDGSDMH